MSNLMLNFTECNPALAKVTQFQSTEKWANLYVKHLPANESEAYLSILEKLNPEQFAEIEDKQNLQICSLMYRDGNFNRSYPLSLQSHPDSPTGLAIKMGTIIFHIKSFDDLDVDIESVKINAYPNPSLVITVETGEVEPGSYDSNMVMLPLPLWLNTESFDSFREEEMIGLKKLQMLVKKSKFSELSTQLLTVKIGDGTSSRNPMINVSELPQETQFSILSVREINTKFGKSFIICIDLNGTPTDLWMPNDIKRLFNLGACVSSSSRFSYTSSINKRYNKPQITSFITDLVSNQVQELAF